MNQTLNNSVKSYADKFLITYTEITGKYKIVLLTPLLIQTSIFACDANCVTCHPKLLKNGAMDNNHKILERCIKCHTKDEDNKNHGSCGQDYWPCHDITKVNKVDIPEHRILPTCIKCHESINKHLFVPSNNTFSQKTLQTSFLKGL